jgi:predicted MFS family arabinose efflux permease
VRSVQDLSPTLSHRGLTALLAAEVVSTTGSMMTWLALPWFVLATTGSAGRMGLVLAVEALGVALCGLPGGKYAARIGARRTMVTVNAVAAPAILLIPLLHWAGLLSFPLLLAIVFGIGGLFGPYFAAQRVAIAEILGDDEAKVSGANAWLQGATRVTMLLGPPLAGVLIALIGAPAVLVVDAGTFAFALVVIWLFVPAAEPLERADEESDVLAGIRYLWSNRLLRSWTATIAVGDAAWNALFATLPFYAFTQYDGNPKVAGLLVACFGVAAVVGNVLSFRVRKRLEPHVLIAVFVLCQAAALWLLVGAGPAVWVAAALLAAGLANGICNPSLHAMTTLMIPPAVRSQALTAVLVINQLAAPVGFLGAGVLLARWGVRPVFILVPAIQTLAMGTRALATLGTVPKLGTVPRV